MIDLHDVHKSYGRRPVLRGVGFTARPGRVTGFLGPNGAGKSTTLRILCGLSEPDAGEALIDGIPYRRHPNVGSRIGVMLDASALHPGRTGRETVRLAAMMTGASRARADALLGQVGLAAAATRRVGGYSLGMRQRLGIAVALVGDPEVLILDEPVNGLDPEGIHWMRTLVRDFAAAGGTVLISSHLLNEVAATVDDVVILRSGTVARQASLGELVQTGHGVLVESPDLARLQQALSRRGLDWSADGTDGADGAGIRIEASAETVGRLILAEQILVTALRPSERSTIEDIFLEITGEPESTAIPGRPSAEAVLL